MTLGAKVAAAAGTMFNLAVMVVLGAVFGIFTILVVNPIYHWFTGEWVDSVVYELAFFFWAAVSALGFLNAWLGTKSVEDKSRCIPYLRAVVGEFSGALMLTGFFATLVALGGPFVALAAFFGVFKNGVTVREAFEISLVLGCGFSAIELCTLAYKRGWRGERKDMAYYLRKAEKYRSKAEAAGEPGLTAAFETLAREYTAKAHAPDPAHPSNEAG
jgi:hypothetical protein